MMCKVYKEAGKSEMEYRSYYVKEKRTCPRLQSIICKYCKSEGHTEKYCKKLEARNKANEKNNIRHKYYENKIEWEKEKESVMKRFATAYAAAAFGSESESEGINRNRQESFEKKVVGRWRKWKWIIILGKK